MSSRKSQEQKERKSHYKLEVGDLVQRADYPCAKYQGIIIKIEIGKEQYYPDYIFWPDYAIIHWLKNEDGAQAPWKEKCRIIFLERVED